MILWIATHICRIYALAWLVGTAVWFGSNIGEERTTFYVTDWVDACGAVTLFASYMLVGFFAGREGRK